MSIRFANEQDLPAILDIYSPYILNTAYSFEYTIPTLEEFTRRFQGISHWFPWLVWEEDGRVLGYAYGSPPFERAAYQWCSESSIYLAPEAQGKGIGRKLNTALEDLLRKQGYQKVYAIITTANASSIAFHEALGYRFTARFDNCGFKFGQWYGTVWLEKQLSATQMPTTPPVSVWDIVKNDRNFL